MSEIAKVLARVGSWSEPRVTGTNPLPLICRMDGPAAEREIALAWPDTTIPQQVKELWLCTAEASLFIDVSYGQWGLRLLSPTASASRTGAEQMERPQQFRLGDIILGEFLGDQDLLVIDARGGVLIALPLYSRTEWYRPATTLLDFLRRYIDANGDKYWEKSHRNQTLISAP